MLKKLLISAVTGAMLSISPLSNAVADCGCGGFTLGFSGGMVVAGSDFNSEGNIFYKAGDSGFVIGEKFKHDKGLYLSTNIGFELFPSIILGLEAGYKDVRFVPEDGCIFSQNIDTKISYISLRADKFIILKNNFDILLGAHVGIANVDLSGFVNDAVGYFNSSPVSSFSGDFDNIIIGLRAGFAYNFAENVALSLNYSLTSLPKIKNESIITERGQMYFSDLKYLIHGVDLGLEFRFIGS